MCRASQIKAAGVHGRPSHPDRSGSRGQNVPEHPTQITRMQGKGTWRDSTRLRRTSPAHFIRLLRETLSPRSYSQRPRSVSEEEGQCGSLAV